MTIKLKGKTKVVELQKKSTPDNKAAADELESIKDEMLELLRRAEKALRGTPEESRARSYWWAHIRGALDKEHGFLGGSMITMQESVNNLRNDDEDDDDDQD